MLDLWKFLKNNTVTNMIVDNADHGGRAVANFVQENAPIVTAGAVVGLTAYVAHRKGYLHMPNLQMPNRPAFLGGKPASVQTPTDTSASSSRTNEDEVAESGKRSRSPSPTRRNSGSDD